MSSYPWLVMGVACICVAATGCSPRPSPTEDLQAERDAGEAAEGQVTNLTDANFDQAIASGVVLVDFWAPWCPPCRVQGPLVAQTAAILGDQAVVAKLNVDEGKASAQKHGVTSIPTLIVFKDGKPVTQFVGVTQPDTLVTAVREALGKK